MNRQLIQLLISLLFLLLPFLAAGLFCLRGRKIRSVSAPRANKVTKMTESISLFSGGIVILIYLGCFKNGLLLSLDKLRPAFAATHIIVASVFLTFILLGVFISWIGRTSWAVILVTIFLFCYSAIMKQSAFNKPSYFMTLIAPKYSWEPIVNYSFEVNNGLEGAEIWINGVFLGTSPLKMTGREFLEKVPLLTEPPEGFSDENKNRPKGNWFRFTMWVPKRNEDYKSPSMDMFVETKNYYARIGYNGEWANSAVGGTGGGGGGFRYDYKVSFTGSIPGISKLYQIKKNRFNMAIQKARLLDYQVDKAWLETIDTYGEKGWRDILALAKNEKEFTGILDKWARWKYDIEDNMTQKQASKIIDKICSDADASRSYDSDDIQGMSLRLIYDKLNLNDLIKRYDKILNTRTEGFQPKSKDVLYQAVSLWDERLNLEGAGKTNIIEKKITPELILHGDIGKASALGGPDIEKYLLRQYQRNTRIEGIELGSGNYEYTMGMHLNRWLYNLAFMKSRTAAKFRENNRQEIMKLAEIMTNNNFNNARKPPEFLFYDLDLGEKSMAYEYWPEYSVQVESSFPGWWYDKLKKRWEYLNRLGSLATEDLYIHCWKIADFKSMLMGGYLQQALSVLPPDKRVPITNAIINELLDIANKKRQDIGLDINAMHYFQEDECVDMAKEFLVKSGDEESLQWLLSKYEDQKKYILERLKRIMQDESTPGYPMNAILVKQEDPALRLLSLESIRKFPTPANRKILDQLLNDSDEQVRIAAQQFAAELEAIKNIPLGELVSEPKGN